MRAHTMTRTQVVDRSKTRPEGQIETTIGPVVWACWGDRMHFRSTEHSNNVVNTVEMRIRLDIKLVDGAWRRDSLSANRTGGYGQPDVSWAAREKIEKVLLEAAAKLFTPLMRTHAFAASAWDESSRKIGEIAQCKEKLATLEAESEALLIEYGKALDAFDKESP